MLRFIWRQVRARAGRSAALLAGVLAATTGFVVLTGTTTTSRLQTTEAVEHSTRAAYEVLVRPRSSRTPLEEQRRLVRPNYLSGLFGGITMDQYERVRAVPGVEVAAPIAMLGYTTNALPAPLDLTAAVDRSLARQVIRVDLTYVAERGLSTAPAKPRYVYVTKRPLISPVVGGDNLSTPDAMPYTDGRTYPTPCGVVPREVLPGGRSAPVCDLEWNLKGLARTSERDIWSIHAVHLLPDGRFQTPGPVVTAGDEAAPTARLTFPLALSVPMLVAAIDPAAEAELAGLDRAVVEGRPLRADDLPADETAPNVSHRTVPVLATSRPYLDGAVRAAYTRLTPGEVAGVPQPDLAAALDRDTGVPAGTGGTDVATGYREAVTQDAGWKRSLQRLIQAGPAEYDELPGGALRARVVPQAPAMSDASDTATDVVPRPWLGDDASLRTLRDLPAARRSGGVAYFASWRAVGLFDPERLAGFSEVSRVPLETYEPPAALGADDRSRQALGDRPLLPSGNPGGYLSAPPLLLTTLAAVPGVLEGADSARRAAPISAIRVRVSDVDGYSERSAERVRLVAERIVATTGLDVDVTLGSSPAPQTVELPAGAFGRPALRLTEHWSAIGVAAVVVQAVDRKSAVLFLLVLVVCVLFLANAVAAAVRARTPELAVLACLGWSARRIGALVLGEVVLIGLAAGVLSLGLAPPIAAALDIGVSWWRAALAVPVALLVSLAAGAAPALRASRAHPAAALHPAVARARAVRRPRRVLGLALANLTRNPGRTALAAAALAIGVAALTMVAAAVYAFRGALVGSLLGDTISLSVRGADAVAAVATVLLGVAAVADVLYLNIRDRATELSALQATGWPEHALVRLIAYEGTAIGLLGSVAGASLGLAGTAWLLGALPPALALGAAATAAGATLLATVAALVPATLLRHRIPTARLLAED
jgi:putative ABC transport system permease protein